MFDSLRPSQQFFSHVRTGYPGLNQYLVEDRVSVSTALSVRLDGDVNLFIWTFLRVSAALNSARIPTN